MKLLVFAHTPPPHHGQSFMVKLMLEGLGGDVRPGSPGEPPEIACFHVNCRVSADMEDIGAMRFGKLWLLLRYCLEAIWCRFRHGVRAFYYIPAPGKRCALYRDWMVMLLCRPFFPRLILHWHASGLGDWLEQNGCALERWITHALLGRPSLSIALAEASSRDARWLHSRRIAIVPNGIPDPCPAFDREILPCRKARAAERRGRSADAAAVEAPPVFRVLYLAHCTREKGLFDTLEGIALLNARPALLRVHCTVAGAFMDAREESAFHERIARPDLAGAVTYAGFTSGEKKKRLLEESDCLCFPTYYPAESFPLTLVEAAAYGLPSVATRWRAIPEIQPPDYPGFVEPKAPAQIADALERLAVADLAEPLRARFLTHFSIANHLKRLTEAFLGVEPGEAGFL
ncbi:MAG: glycosyltransferase family 4 protein [Verrucomicrobiota bacterium]